MLGAQIDDLVMYFDRPDRLIASFTAPNQQKVWSVRQFNSAGMINTTEIAAQQKVVATRVWKRVAERPGLSGVNLL